MRRGIRLGLRITLLLALGSVPVGLTSSAQVPASRAGIHDQGIPVNDKKPNECDGIVLSDLVAGSGSVTAGSASELVLAGSGADTIDAGAGDDCVVGGGGDDTVNGGDGTDVCIGGPGTDAFTDCETVIQ